MVGNSTSERMKSASTYLFHHRCPVTNSVDYMPKVPVSRRTGALGLPNWRTLRMLVLFDQHAWLRLSSCPRRSCVIA